MAFKSYRKESKTDWGTTNVGETLSIEQINCGAILRIADATEKMAVGYDRMQAELNYLKNTKEFLLKQNDKLRRANAALRGHIKTLKK